MALKEPKRVTLTPDTDLVDIVEAVHTDGTPRLIEREGKALAVVVGPDDYQGMLAGPTAEGIARALAAAGAWKDLDTDILLETLDHIRHDSPASPPVHL